MLRDVAKTLDLALLPAEAEAMEADCYIVVDLLRATTTIATLFARGLTDLIVAGDIDLARAVGSRDGRLLFGEVGGLRPAGFDHGNSPVEAAAADVAGRGAVLFTTNGTLALCAMAGRGDVYTGAIANLSAAAHCVGRYERTVIVCAGTESGRRFALEDLAGAGIIIRRAARACPGLELGDAAGLAIDAWGYDDWLSPGLPQQPGKSTRLVSTSQHGRLLMALGFGDDLHFAMREDSSAALPMVTKHGEGWALLENRAVSDRR